MSNAIEFSNSPVASAIHCGSSIGLLRFVSGMAFTLAASAWAAEPPAATPQTPPAARAVAPRPAATLSNVAYGDHPRQVLDFWKAPGTKPTPVVFHIHGGGWGAGNKGATRETAAFLAAGISVVSISYRYTWQAIGDGIKPAVSAPMHDAARALQLVRSKASEWNIDKKRIAATGASAGACTSLWLAFHDDMADPKSTDPIARESTRLFCVAVDTAQTSLDPKQMKEWTPNIDYGATAFNFADPTPTQARAQSLRFADFLAHRDEILPWIKEYSPIEHASRDDPPIYMIYPTPPGVGLPQPDATHSTNFGVKLQERLNELKVECELVYPGAPDVKHPSIQVYLIEKLRPAL
ncbi:MAG: alpha/beta hydrolase fold domain-containing protein [Opitutaceae bacterium]